MMRATLIFLVLLAADVVAAVEKTARVVASVSHIALVGAAPDEFVSVIWCLHHPTRLQGTSMQIVINHRDRKRVRNEMPVGSMHEITLPATVISDLHQQQDRQEHVQKMIDQGTHPEHISAAIIAVRIRSADLPAPITPFPLKQ